MAPSTLIEMLDAGLAKAERGITMFSAAGETRVGYREVSQRIDQATAALSFLGVAPGDRIVLILPQGVELVTAFFACISAGAIPSILPPVSQKQDPQLYWRDIQILLERIKGKALITFPAYAVDAQQLLANGSTLVVTMPVLMAMDAPPLSRHVAKPRDIAFLQHSSGTTAVKKGVTITHAAAVAQLEAYAGSLSIRPDDCVVSWLPLYHDMGLIACLLLPVALGLDLVMIDTFEWLISPGLLFAAIEKHRGTLVWLPNFAFQHLTDIVSRERRYDLSSMRAFINCSEPCRADTMRAFAARFAGEGAGEGSVAVCYAMAETVLAVTQTPLGSAPKTFSARGVDFSIGSRIEPAGEKPSPQDFVSCGPPISGADVAIFSDTNAALGAGIVGQIAVRAPYLFEGYYALPQETAHVFHDGWYLTGDLGFMHDGELYVSGRLKDTLIIRGKNIMAHDVEAVISRVGGVKRGRVVAIGVFDEATGSDHLVVVAERSDAGPASKDLKAAVRREATRVMGIAVSRVYIAPAGWIVKSTSGKLNRKESFQKFTNPESRGLLE